MPVETTGWETYSMATWKSALPSLKSDHIQELCSYNTWSWALSRRNTHLAASATGTGEGQAGAPEAGGQWGRKQPHSVVVTQGCACQGTDAEATNCKDNSADLTANHILPILLPSKLAPRFPDLSASNSIHSTNTMEWLCQTLFKTLDLLLRK